MRTPKPKTLFPKFGKSNSTNGPNVDVWWSGSVESRGRELLPSVCAKTAGASEPFRASGSTRLSTINPALPWPGLIVLVFPFTVVGNPAKRDDDVGKRKNIPPTFILVPPNFFAVIPNDSPQE